MISNKTVIEVKKDEKLYQLFLSPQSTLGETFDVLSEMRSYIVERIVEAEQAQKNEQKPE